jgi:hypothetical protein
MVSRTAHINFLKPARGALVAPACVRTQASSWQATLVESGRVIIDVEVDTRDSADVCIAELQVEWHVSRRPARIAS